MASKWIRSYSFAGVWGKEKMKRDRAWEPGCKFVWRGTLETCIVLWTNVTPINSIKKEGTGQVTQLVRASFWYAKGCGFYLQSWHIQRSTNECINDWKNKLMFLSLPSSLSLKPIKIFFKYLYRKKKERMMFLISVFFLPFCVLLAANPFGIIFLTALFYLHFIWSPSLTSFLWFACVLFLRTSGYYMGKSTLFLSFHTNLSSWDASKMVRALCTGWNYTKSLGAMFPAFKIWGGGRPK